MADSPATPAPDGATPGAGTSGRSASSPADLPPAAEGQTDRRPPVRAASWHDVSDWRVVLASASPRRRELLHRLGIDPVVRPSDVDETPRPDELPDALVARLAATKCATAVVGPDTVVIAADTEVVLDGATLGKPSDADHARRMLRSLSGRSHRVVTGVHVRTAATDAHAVESTEVRVRPLSDAEIDAYVASGEPMGKAGAYAIQGLGGAFVASISGSDTNVIGLPLARTVDLLREVGVGVLLG